MPELSDFDDGTDTGRDQTAAEERARELFESVIAYGRPACDECFRLSPDERAGYDGFFNDEVTQFPNVDGETLNERTGPTLCDGHAERHAELAPDATHRVEIQMVPAEDHRMKTAYRYRVLRAESLR